MELTESLSIFAKPATYQRTPKLPFPHLIRASSIIRGDQIAEYLGCKLNPIEGYENDTLIYVKPPRIGDIKAGSWIDVMDSPHILQAVIDRPYLNLILFSLKTLGDIQFKNIKNNMVVIPQHHCNFDRIQRVGRTIENVGFIGGEIGFTLPVDEITKRLAEYGLKFLYLTRYKTREDVIDFYKKIDVQITWTRPEYQYQSKCPLKLTNSASFNIPTVAYPQDCYEEADGHYIKAYTIDKLVEEVVKLKDEAYYQKATEGLVAWSERYHISRIAELYKQLCKTQP